MGLHHELSAAAPPTIVLPAAAAGAASPSDDRSTASESKSMDPAQVADLVTATAVIYQRRYESVHLPQRRFMKSIFKAVVRVERRADGSDRVTWYPYPIQEDATRVARTKTTITIAGTAAPAYRSGIFAADRAAFARARSVARTPS